MGIQIAGGFIAIQRPVHSQPQIRIECASNPVFRASTRNAYLRMRILTRITQSTSVGGLNLHWFIDCEAREMAGSAWSVEETRALLNLWGDDRVQRQLEAAFDGRTMPAYPTGLLRRRYMKYQPTTDTLSIATTSRRHPPAHSSHQRSAYAFMHVIMRLLVGDSVSSRYRNCIYTNVTRPFPPRDYCLTRSVRTYTKTLIAK